MSDLQKPYAASVSAEKAGRDLFKACMEQAARMGEELMERLVDKARLSMRVREEKALDPKLRGALLTAQLQLNKHKASMCERFPDELARGFADALGEGETHPMTRMSGLSMDDLELMDESQVQETVELARAQHIALSAVENRLPELDALISAAKGLKTVRADANPLRPENYVRAMRKVVAHTPADSVTRLHWMQDFGTALGVELTLVYDALIKMLKAAGVRAASYKVIQSPDATGSFRRAVAQVEQEVKINLDPQPTAFSAEPTIIQGLPDTLAGGDEPEQGAGDESKVLLTVDQLRRLLAGELDFIAPDEAPGQTRAPSTNFPATDFQLTVPAAYEMLEEMKKVDGVMKRMQQRATVASASPGAPKVTTGRELGQALGQEVVSLMIDNIANDKRLLEPIRAAVRKMQPAFVQLAQIDPRFFSEKQHPARLLLDRLTQRSLAFQSVQSEGFAAFYAPIEEAQRFLGKTAINGAEPFAQALQVLEDEWNLQQRQQREQRDKAMKALMRAEQRNLLAEKFAADIRQRSDLSDAPDSVVDFLCGPWAQVLAQARLSQQGLAGAGDKYGELVPDLLWSCKPELAARNRPRLIRLIPPLLSRLREGLKSIDYPSGQSQPFFNQLIALHNEALNSEPQSQAPSSRRGSGYRELEMNSKPWIAPREARHSGFLEAEQPVPAEPAAPEDMLAEPFVGSTMAPLGNGVALGSWFDLKADGQTTRVQLSWATPHGTLFMFTGPGGRTHSMTRRTLDLMLVDGSLKSVTSQAVVDSALDAVALLAMKNSMTRH